MNRLIGPVEPRIGRLSDSLAGPSLKTLQTMTDTIIKISKREWVIWQVVGDLHTGSRPQQLLRQHICTSCSNRQGWPYFNLIYGILIIWPYLGVLRFTPMLKFTEVSIRQTVKQKIGNEVGSMNQFQQLQMIKAVNALIRITNVPLTNEVINELFADIFV